MKALYWFLAGLAFDAHMALPRNMTEPTNRTTHLLYGPTWDAWLWLSRRSA